ncbi:MAG: universal stress protein [Rhodospirillaceae bacterium]
MPEKPPKSLKDIIVHLDTTEASGRRVQAAVNLATAHGAHLTGVGVLYQPYIPAYAEAQISLELIEQKLAAQRVALEEVSKAFAATADGAGASAEWRVSDGEPVDVLGESARYGDLTILSQSEDTGEILPGGHEIPDRVLLTSGRPALVVPSIHDGAPFGKSIVVAWDASRMAARAVHYAMPLLQKADQVTIMVANPKPGVHGHGDLPGADLAAHLARHGVAAEADHTVSDDVGIGDLLLSRAADAQADMIVLGAYGSRAVARAGDGRRHPVHAGAHAAASADVALGGSAFRPACLRRRAGRARPAARRPGS